MAPGHGGSGAERPWHPDVPPDWAAAADRIAAGGVRRVLVLGPGDAGKSTFCRVLLHRAAQNGREAALLDADPARKLAGPPACDRDGTSYPPSMA